MRISGCVNSILQIVKVCVSLYYGSRMQCQVLPEKLGRLKIEQYAAEMEAANTYKAQRVPGTGTESTRAESESHAHE